jgi:hypothetical protein
MATLTSKDIVDYKEQGSEGFVNRSLSAVPQWALAVIGVLFALTIFLAFSGLQSPIMRVANAYAARIERAVDHLEQVVEKAKAIEARVNDIDARLRVVEEENGRMHKK